MSSNATERRPATARSASAGSAASSVTGRSASSTKPAFVEKVEPETGTLIAPGRCPARWSATGRTSSSCVSSRGVASSGGSGAAGVNGRLVLRDDAREVGRLRRGDAGRLRDERVDVRDREHRVEPALEADRRRSARAHRHAAQRPRDVAGEDLDAVGKLEEPPEGVEEALGALGRPDSEIRPRGVADEERVAGQDEPRLVGARRVDHGETAVLRPVPRRVDAAKDDGPDLELVPVRERIVRVVDLRGGVDADRDAELEREAPVPGDVVRVRVRLDRPHEPGPEPLGLAEDRARSRGAGRRRPPRRPPRIRRGTRRTRDRRSGSARRARRPDGSTGLRYPT